MSNEEIKIIQKIFEFKLIKSDHILSQKYAAAADARDRERVYEWKLMKFLGHSYSIETNEDKQKFLIDYFSKNFEIEYTKNTTNEFKKNILRQIKLNELGIK